MTDETNSIDLDRARAARREAKGQGPVVHVNGADYQLAPELPYEVLEHLRGLNDPGTAPQALVDTLRSLTGEHYEAITSGMSLDDVNELVGQLMRAYGLERPLG